MKKLKMFGLALVTMMFCTLGVSAANITFSENSVGGKVTITHSLTKDLKYQWIKVDAATYSAKAPALKAIVNELKPLYTAFTDAKKPLADAKAKYDTANSNYQTEKAKDANSDATKKAREEVAQAYNEYIAVVDSVNAAANTYNAKAKEFNAAIAEVAPYEGSKWQAVSGNQIDFDNTGYVNEDAAVLWIQSNENGTPEYDGKIYLYDGTNLAAQIDCNKTIEPETPKPENPVPETPKEEGKTTENPKTGYALPIAAGLVVLGAGGVVVVLANKKKLFKQI